MTAAATLAGVFDTGHGSRARVRLTIVPHESDTTVTVTRVTQEEAAQAGLSSSAERPVLARTSVAKGARRQLFVETDLESGRDNHLFFLVSTKGKSVQRQVVHLLVSLDESARPEIVGEYIQYQGAPAQEREP